MGILALGLLAALAAETIPLPGPVAAVQVRHGRAVALAGAPGAPELRVWSREGKPVRTITVRDALPQARSAEVLGFTIREDGSVQALVYGSLPLGRDERFLCTFPHSGQPRCTPVPDVRCRLLAADGLDSLWCFGEGPADLLLHRIAGPREGPRFWLPRDAIPLPAEAAARNAWMDAPAPGRITLVLPAPALALHVDLRNGEVQLQRLPLPGRPGAASFALSGSRLLALLPLKGSPDAEPLDAPYGLFELRGAWQRVAPGRQWLRGARLAGAEPGAAWIWNRAAQRLERVPLPGP